MQDKIIKKLWHTNRKCFIDEFSILQTINSEGNFEHTYFERKPNLALEKIPTCQIKEILSTSVKDKKGILIFEGDIVKIRDYNALGYLRERIGVVEYKYGDYYPAFYVITTLGDAKDFTDNMEVIGNIYETPELLAKEGDNE